MQMKMSFSLNMSFKLVPLLLLAISYSAAQGAPSGARIPIGSPSYYPSLLQKHPNNDEAGPFVVFQTSENDVHSIPVSKMEDLDSQAEPIMFSEKFNSGLEEPHNSLPLLVNSLRRPSEVEREPLFPVPEMKLKRSFQYYGARGKKSGLFNFNNDQMESRFNYMPSRG